MKTIYYLLLLLALMCHCVFFGQNRWIEDTQMNFKIQVPSNYKASQFWDGTDKIHAFLSPDQNVAVRVRSFAIQNNVSVNSIIQAFTQNVINGATALVSQKYTLNGMEGQLAGYRWRYNNISVIIAAFYTTQNNFGYIVWTMIPENMFAARNAESDAITNSFSLISKQIVSTVEPVSADTPLKYIQTVSASPPVIINNISIGDKMSQDINFNSTEIHLKANFQGNPKEFPFLIKWFSKTHKCLIAEEYQTPKAADLQVLHSFIDNSGEQWPAGDYLVQVWHFGHKVAEKEFTLKQPEQKPTNLLGTTQNKESKPVTNPTINTSVKQIVLDNNSYAYDFATGKTRNTYEPEPDVMNRPWCTDLPALSGNWARSGKSRMEDVTSPPVSGYISDGKSFIDVQEAPLNEVLVFKLSNGRYAKLMIIKDEKSQTSSGCQHKITCLVQYPAF